MSVHQTLFAVQIQCDCSELLVVGSLKERALARAVGIENTSGLNELLALPHLPKRSQAKYMVC